MDVYPIALDKRRQKLINLKYCAMRETRDTTQRTCRGFFTPPRLEDEVKERKRDRRVTREAVQVWVNLSCLAVGWCTGPCSNVFRIWRLLMRYCHGDAREPDASA